MQKRVIGDLRARSERGVRQEIYAAFVLLILTRQFANRCDDGPTGGGEDGQPAMRANFRNGLRPVGKGTGDLFLRQAGAVRESVARIMAGLSRCIQRERPGKSHPRQSKPSGSRWQARPAG